MPVGLGFSSRILYFVIRFCGIPLVAGQFTSFFNLDCSRKLRDAGLDFTVAVGAHENTILRDGRHIFSYLPYLDYIKELSAYRRCSTGSRSTIELPQNGFASIIMILMRLVKGEGPKNAKIVFVGEAPGKEEEKQGRPFVGRAGKLLTHILEKLSIPRSRVYITNVVKIRPRTRTGENRKPTAKEIQRFLPSLRRELARLKPRLIVLLGDTSVKALLGEGHLVSRSHGRIIRRGEKTYLITYHPAAALRFPKARNALEGDLKKLQRHLSRTTRILQL